MSFAVEWGPPWRTIPTHEMRCMIVSVLRHNGITGDAALREAAIVEGECRESVSAARAIEMIYNSLQPRNA